MRPESSLSGLMASARHLEQTESGLLEVAKMAQHDLARIAIEMEETENLLARKDEMLAALNQLSIRAGEKNTGLFESLLTDLIHEVNPGNNDRVVLTSSMRNNRASLDFDILCDGNLENIGEDKGGSISNIVAMGLRFIVLARHPNRRVLLLDEADCHLKTQYVPAFASVMHQLAIKMGIQVIYISHHAASNFIGYGRVHELYRESGRTHARVMHHENEADGSIDTMGAFRYVRLCNFGPHENLFLELSPGLNVLTGDNDIGKSKVVQAMAELTENNGVERRIRHGSPHFSVELGLEEGMSLHWKYLRKGSRRTSMVLKDSDGNTIESSEEGSSIPPWLDTYLAMPKVNGENIHYHSQKQPNYLLSNNDYTSSKRAEMLPLGRESRDVYNMIQAFNARLVTARHDHSRLQKDMHRVKNTLSILAPLLDDPMDMDALNSAMESLVVMQQERESLVAHSKRLVFLKELREEVAKKIEQVTSLSVPEVSLQATQQMQDHIDHFTQVHEQRRILTNCASLAPAPQMPVLSEAVAVKQAHQRLSQLTSIRDLFDGLKGLQSPPSFELSPAHEMLKQVEKITGLSARQAGTKQKLTQCREDQKSIATRKATLYQAMGGVCPTCDKPLEDHAHD